MIRTHLKLILRKLKKERLYTAVNVTGLTVALTACLLVGLYVKDELTFDRFHADHENLYRLMSLRGEERLPSGGAYADFGQYVIDGVPEITALSRIIEEAQINLLESEDGEFYVKPLIYVDSNFLEFFSFSLKSGNATSALSSSSDIVLTESIATKLFGDESAIGKEIRLNKKSTHIVSAVVEDPPKNSSIQFRVLLPLKESQVENTFSEGYLRGGINFFRVRGDADITKVNEAINRVKEVPSYAEVMQDTDFRLMPMTDQRLKSGLGRDFLLVSDIKLVYLFGSIGIVILLLALINYVNMVTAQSIHRAKETGLRRVIGAKKSHLALDQFLTSTVITSFSMAFAFAICERLMPLFNEMTQKDIRLSYLSWEFLLLVPLFGLVVGFFAALYPMFRIVKINPLVLVGKSSSGLWSDQRLKKLFILIQFTAAVILLIVTFTMQNQMNFLKKSKLGFERELLINVPLFSDLKGKSEVLKQEVSRVKGVETASVTDWMIGGYTSSAKSVSAPDPEQDVSERPKYVRVVRVEADESILATLKVEVIESLPNFDFNNLDSTQLVISESTVESLGWTDGALGKRLFEYSGKSHEVVAVIKDFHSASFKQAIEPTSIQTISELYGNEDLLIRLESDQHQETLKEIAQVYEQITDRPFEYTYVNEVLDRYYKEEADQIALFNIFTSLAMVISLLGLVAMIALAANQRRKEISIRKVLGASVAYLIFLLNQSFVKLILIAFVIAVPVAYYSTSNWLDSFEYRVSLNPLMYLLVLAGFLFISALVTMSQSLKVSSENPADVLREE